MANENKGCDFDSVFEADIGLSDEDKELMAIDVKNDIMKQIGVGTPIRTFESLEALQAEYPSGADGVYLVKNADNLDWYYWLNEWKNGGQYLPNNVEIQKQIDEKISKIKKAFTPVSSIRNRSKLMLKDGSAETRENFSFLEINVLPNQKYLINAYSNNSNRPAYLFLNNDVVIGYSDYISDDYYFENKEITIPSGVNKLVLNSREYTNLHSYASAYEIKYVDTNIDVKTIENKQDNKKKWQHIGIDYENKNVYIGSGSQLVFRDLSNYYYTKVDNIDFSKRYKVQGYCYRDNDMPMIIFTDDNDGIVGVYKNKEGDFGFGEVIDSSIIPVGTTRMYVCSYTSYPSRCYIEIIKDELSLKAGKIGLCLGDSITAGQGELPAYRNWMTWNGQKVSTYKGYPNILPYILGDTIYNGGIGGTTYAYRSEDTTHLDFATIAEAIVSGDFSQIKNELSDEYYLGDGLIYNYEKIAQLDFNKVDYITLFYGTNDWNFNKLLDNIEDPFDKTTTLGALRYGMKIILEKYPNIKFYIFTPIYREKLGTEHNLNSDTKPNDNGIYLYDFVNGIISVAKDYHFPCKDMYYTSGINKYNAKVIIPDGTHPRADGYEYLAGIIAGFINGN